MTCIHCGEMIICASPFYRLRLLDGRHVFMAWHDFCGPTFYLDRHQNREIVDWFEDDTIVTACNWFVERGKKA